MTVAELREILSKLPDSLPVFFPDRLVGDLIEVDRVLVTALRRLTVDEPRHLYEWYEAEMAPLRGCESRDYQGVILRWDH